MSAEVEEVDQGRIDRLIWQYVGRKSVREIAEMTGLTPEKVLQRKNELLEEVDVLTIEQKRQKLLISLDEIAQDAMDKAVSISAEFYAGTLNSAVAAIKTMLGELARMEAKDQGKVEALNQLRVRELLRLVDSTVARTMAQISKEHELDEGDLMEVFQGHLVESARELETE